MRSQHLHDSNHSAGRMTCLDDHLQVLQLAHVRAVRDLDVTQHRVNFSARFGQHVGIATQLVDGERHRVRGRVVA